MTHHLRILTLAGLLAATLAGTAGAAIYQDDFATDPFAARWSTTQAGGSYPLVWTGNTTPNPTWNAGLPVNANNHSVYSGACTWQSMSTTDTSVPTGFSGWVEMTYSLDFTVGGAIPGTSIQMLVNRSGDNGYVSQMYTGGSGTVGWYGSYDPGHYNGTNLELDTWYRFVTTVTKSGADLSMSAQVVRISDNTVMSTSPTYLASAAAYLDPNGFKITSSQEGYWDRAKQLDDFTVIAMVPEPATLALLGLGALTLFRRRR